MKKTYFTKIVLLSALFLTTFVNYPITIGVNLSPVFTTPLSSSFHGTIGGGAQVGISTELTNFLEAGLDTGLYALPTRSSELPLLFAYHGGLAVETFFYPHSQIRLSGGAAGGIYSVNYEFNEDNSTTETEKKQNSYSDIYWRVFAEAGYRFSPTLSITANAGYMYLNNINADQPTFNGLTAGISINISFITNTNEGDLQLIPKEMEPVFPVLRGLYKENPIGTLTLTNNESAEIRNVKISFRASNYTSSELECARTDFLNRGESFPFFLYADFSKTIQNFTEKGKIPGEIIISYDILGENRTITKSLVIDVNSRNTLRWTDTYQVASFVSPNSPEVLDYSKYMVGVARNALRTGLNKKLQFAMYLFEGLKVGGITLSNDDTTPYTTFHKDDSLTDYIQYPFQTLAYHSGDMDDLGLLYAAILESVGISTAIIPLENDFIIAFDLDLSPRKARNHFDGTDKLLNIDDKMWLPLSISVLREGFINSWYQGINSITSAISEGENVELIMLKQAWSVYPPTGITGTEAQFQKPNEDLVIRAVETNLMRYINSEFGPKIRQIKETMQSRGASDRLYNRLALLYVRAGLFDQARAEYLKSVELGSLTAKVNLGNIAFVQNDFETAQKWYKEVLEEYPDNEAALTGMGKVNAELGDE